MVLIYAPCKNYLGIQICEQICHLRIFLYDEMGYAPQERAAHTDFESTQIYMRHHAEWVRVQAAELAI